MAADGVHRSSSYRRWILAAAVVVALLLAYLLRGVLVPLFFAFLLAYALDPFVDRLEALKIPRTIGAILAMGGLIAVVLTTVIFAVPYLIDEFSLAGEQLPAQLEALSARAEPWVWQVLHIRVPHTWAELLSNVGAELQQRMPDLAQTVIVALFGTLNVILIVVGTFIIPVFALYLLIDFDRNASRARDLVPRRWTPNVESIAREIHRTLGGYIRGQLTANLILATLYAVGLKFIGLRLAIPIGVITGMLAFVPYVGFGIGLLMTLVMAILDWQGPNHLLAAVAVMMIVQGIDGMLVTPRVVGHSVGLRPIEVLLTMMAAATLFGFLGVLLAVPLGAVLKILVSRATELYLQSSFYNAPPAAAGGAPSLAAVAPEEPPRAAG